MESIQIEVNGEPMQLPAGSTVETFAESQDLLSRGGMAIAVNGSVIRRGQWADVRLNSGDRVLLLTAAQGG